MVTQEPVVEHGERIYSDEQARAFLSQDSTPTPPTPAPSKNGEAKAQEDLTAGQPAEKTQKELLEQAQAAEKVKEQAATDKAEQEKGEAQKEVKVQEAGKKRRERLKPLSFDGKQPETEKSKEITPQAYSDLEAKYNDTQEILNKPIIQAILKAEQKGESIVDYLAGLQPTDITSKTPEQVYEHSLRLRGVKSVKDDNYKEGERSLEDEMRKFDDAPLSTQDDLVEKATRQIRANDEKRLDGIYQRAASPGQSDTIAQQVKTDLDRIAPAIIGQDAYGIKVTKEIVDDVVKSIYNDGLVPMNQDGTINTQELLRQRLIVNKFDFIMDTFQETIEADATHRTLDRVEATPDSSVHDRLPIIQTKLKEGTEEYAEELSKAEFVRIKD